MNQSIKIQKKWVNTDIEFTHYEFLPAQIQIVSAVSLNNSVDSDYSNTDSNDPTQIRNSFDPVPTMLSQALNLSKQDFSIKRAANQAPFVQLKNEDAILPISISHTEHITLIAFSLNKRFIGIDIEAKTRRIPEGLHSRILSPNELDSDTRSIPVIQLWTLKEAALKWAGTGLRVPMKSVSVQKESDEMFTIIIENEQFNDKRTSHKFDSVNPFTLTAHSFLLDNYWVSIVTAEIETSNRPIESVGVVGAGSLGSAFICEFLRLQVPSLTIYSSKSEDQLKTQFGSKKTAEDTSLHFRSISDLSSEPILPEWIFLTVPDQVIEIMVERLIENPQPNWKDHKILHCSGAHSSELLHPLASKGAQTASIHPLQTFPKSGTTKAFPFERVPFSMEGDTSLLHELEMRLFPKLNAKSFHVTPLQKTTLHLAAALVSNGMVPLLASAKRILEDSGLDEGVERLKILTETTIENVQLLGDEALSGPIKRGDLTTVKIHLDHLGQHSSIQYLYALSGLQILTLLPSKTQDDPAYQEMKSWFQDVVSHTHSS